MNIILLKMISAIQALLFSSRFILFRLVIYVEYKNTGLHMSIIEVNNNFLLFRALWKSGYINLANTHYVTVDNFHSCYYF